MILSDRFPAALLLANHLHRHQTRKGCETPQISHPLAVSAMVLEWGGDEDTAIAALLHDAVEDSGGVPTAELIRWSFGDRVADIVLTSSGSVEPAGADQPWHDRKNAAIAMMGKAPKEVALVVACDKLNNITALIRTISRFGTGALWRFSEPDRLVWYYEALAEALYPHAGVAPVDELRKRSVQLAEMVHGSPYSE